MADFLNNKTIQWIAIMLALIGVVVTLMIFISQKDERTYDKLSEIQINLARNTVEIISNGKISEIILERQNNVIEKQANHEQRIGIIEYIQKDKVIKAIGIFQDTIYRIYLDSIYERMARIR